jgi:hypothetical protein
LLGFKLKNINQLLFGLLIGFVEAMANPAAKVNVDKVYKTA